jgi:hypothetical protein
MFHKSFPALLGLMAVSAVLLASDSWKLKPVREWSREETYEFLRNSPWVRRVSFGDLPVEPGPPDVGAQTDEDRGETSQAAVRARRSELDAGGVNMKGRTVYYVEWSSAKIVRQGRLHFGALQGRVKEDGTEPPDLSSYFLSVSGSDLKAFDGATESQLKTAAYLRLKRSKTKIAPAEVKIRKTLEKGISSIQCAFPREVDGQPVISAEEKSVEFSIKGKNLTLKTSFDLTKMTTEKGRDL